MAPDRNGKNPFDLDDVLDRTGLDFDEYMEIYELYRETFSDLMEGLEAALRLSDMESILHTAHTIKGASSNIGFENLSSLAQKIQGDPEDLDGAKAIVPRMWEIFNDLDDQIASKARLAAN